MGSNESVAAAFELRMADGHGLISFDRGNPREAPTGGWAAALEALQLEVPDAALADLLADDRRPPEARERGIAGLQHRRLRLRSATLRADETRLQDGLVRCRLDGAPPITEARLAMGPAGPRLVGRFTHQNRTAPFTIGVAFHRLAESPRRLMVSFADVRIFGHLAIPAPMIGVAVARAIGSAATTTTIAGAVRVAGWAIDVDPLELALIGALVAQGWRLPDAKRTRLASVAQTAEGVTLHFVDGEGTEAPVAGGSPPPPPPLDAATSFIEGEPSSEVLSIAERHLMAADFAAAEAACRQARLANPADRLVRARLLAITAANNPSGAAVIADALIDDCPDFLPSFLYGAISAREAGDAVRAATLFARAAALADERGDVEDAVLARAAEAEASSVNAGERDEAPSVDVAVEGADPTPTDPTDATIARLENELRTLPLDALEARLHLRQRLGEIHMERSNWTAARHCLELVVAQQPGRADMLEHLAQIYGHLGLHKEAVTAWDRLSRLYANPRHRAAALFQEGEIFRNFFDDEARAFDAYLKSSDLDPSFVPTALRLVAGYFFRGLFKDAAAIGDDLKAVEPPPDIEPALRLRLGLAAAMAQGDATAGAVAAGLDHTPWDAEMAEAAVAECARWSPPPTPAEGDLIAAVVELWRASWGAHSPSGAGDPTSAS